MSRNTHLQRPMPDDFAEMRAKLGGINRLEVHYNAHYKTIRRWLDEAGLPSLESAARRGPAWNRRPVPDDFATLAPTMTKAGLMEHYRTNNRAVDRWLADAGVSPLQYIPPAYSRPPLRFVRAPGYANIAQTRTYGPEDWAADVLRRFGMVCRCDERGRADHKGTHWRIGNTVLTGEELIQRAERKAPRAA